MHTYIHVKADSIILFLGKFFPFYMYIIACNMYINNILLMLDFQERQMG